MCNKRGSYICLQDKWLIKIKMIMKNSSYRYDINRPRPTHGNKYNDNIKSVSLWCCLYVLSKI